METYSLQSLKTEITQERKFDIDQTVEHLKEYIDNMAPAKSIPRTKTPNLNTETGKSFLGGDGNDDIVVEKMFNSDQYITPEDLDLFHRTMMKEFESM